MLVRQCRMTSGNSVMVVWVEDRPVKTGQRIKFKNSPEPVRWWTVASVGEVQMDVTNINRGWNNNI